MQENCVFCKIIRGELPCDKLYEDDRVIAFLDISPTVKGHTLVVPKEHHVSLTTLPDDYRAQLMTVAPTIAAALMRAVDGDGFNLLLSNGECAGQVVPHVHLHVMPRRTDDAFSLWPPTSVEYDANEKDDLLEKTRTRLDSI